MAGYQHSSPRQWQDHEVEFLAQAASHLGVAVQQANLLEQQDQRTTELQDTLDRQRALTEGRGEYSRISRLKRHFR